MIPYQSNVMLNLVTCGLIIFGGIGFLVIRELWDEEVPVAEAVHARENCHFRKHRPDCGGETLLIKATEDVTWMGAFFHSVSARTAGFSTYPLGSFTTSGLLILIVLMFYRGVAGIHRRRYQDQHFLRADPEY